MAKYFMELMLVDYQCVKFTPSNRAASALWLALKLLYQRDWVSINKTKSIAMFPTLSSCLLLYRIFSCLPQT